jgi:hypothetical protein
LKDGQGNASEEPVEMHPDHELQATTTGQVATSLKDRDISQVILEDFRRLRKDGTPAEMLAAIRKWTGEARQGLLPPRVLSETPAAEFVTQRIAVETEPGLELDATVFAPRTAGRKPAVLIVETSGAATALGQRLARSGKVALALAPRNLPLNADRLRQHGDWLGATRAWLVGRNLPGMRAYDIRRGIDVLAARPDVDPSAIRAAARDVAGVWLLLAAAADSRIGGIWLDRTPHSLRAALENPVHRDLHDAVLPGFALRWDLQDIVKAIQPRHVIWTDPTDWVGNVRPLGAPFRYRPFEGPDSPYLEALLR